MTILLNLLLAHFIADFLLQNKHFVETKKYSGLPLLLHSFIVGIVSFIFVRMLTITVSILVSHFIIDFAKNRITKYIGKSSTKSPFCITEILLFVLDQVLHIAVIIFLLSIFKERILYISYLQIPEKLSIICLAYLITIWVSSFLIGFLTKPYEMQIKEDKESGLTGAGKIIGQLERFIILTMILTNNPIGIGFIFTAKSIFRFENLKKRKLAEYILIGTLYSFVLAIAIGYLTRYLLKMVK
ncbi:MAG: DUF3307 domain-containing protein [Candidatus Cloacimonetes bacterium]|nr:DUF3307 domain-containing protein [Candidatus Cloacimonadota bacterium]